MVTVVVPMKGGALCVVSWRSSAKTLRPTQMPGERMAWSAVSPL